MDILQLISKPLASLKAEILEQIEKAGNHAKAEVLELLADIVEHIDLPKQLRELADKVRNAPVGTDASPGPTANGDLPTASPEDGGDQPPPVPPNEGG